MKKGLLFLLLLFPCHVFAFTYSVSDVKGKEAFVMEEGSSHRSALSPGMTLVEGQSVQTGARTVVFISSSNGHQIHIGTNSSISLHAPGSENGVEYNVIDLLGGSIRSIVEKSGSETKKFEVRYHAVALGVRGTDFLTVVSGAFADVFLNEGKILLQNKVALTGGNKATISGSGEIKSTSSMTKFEFARAIELAGFGSDSENGGDDSGASSKKKKPDSAVELVREGDVHGLKALELSAADLNNLGGGEGALHVAAKNGRTEMIQSLLSQGADIDGRNDDGKTPLMVAIERKSVPSIRVLLSAGANKKIEDSSGRSAYDYARLSESREIQDLLGK